MNRCKQVRGCSARGVDMAVPTVVIRLAVWPSLSSWSEQWLWCK